MSEIFELFKKNHIYDPITGNIIGPSGKIKKSKTYIKCSLYIDGKNIYLDGHRLAYYIQTGEIPNYVDHINGIKNDNRFCNLRNVTQQKNMFNRRAKGYSWNKQHNKYKSSIMLDGKQIHVGYFDTEIEAKKAYLNAKKIYHII